MTERAEEQELEADETFAEVCEARRAAWVEALESEGEVSTERSE